jgi:hypothetical protein
MPVSSDQPAHIGQRFETLGGMESAGKRPFISCGAGRDTGELPMHAPVC